MLQKQEQKQFQDLATKENLALEQQERKFEQERQNLERTYENDLEVLSRQQRYLCFLFPGLGTRSVYVFLLKNSCDDLLVGFHLICFTATSVFLNFINRNYKCVGTLGMNSVLQKQFSRAYYLCLLYCRECIQYIDRS